MKILAVSGGVDSMCMFDMMLGEEIVVVHINHKTRGFENEKEEKLVQKICLKNNIPFYKFDFDYSNQTNFHKEAREFRYSKFLEVSKDYNSSEVYLAHHMDDQIENIMMNKNKIGSKLINEKQYIDGVNIVRPILHKNKQDIYKYAKINNVEFIEDSSNSSSKYLRNRVRKKLANYTYKEKKIIYEKELKRTEKLKELQNYYKKKKKISLNELILDEINIYCYLKGNNITSNISINKILTIINFLKKSKNGSINIDKDYVLINSYGKITVDKYEKETIKPRINVIEGEYYKFNNILIKATVDGYVRIPEVGDKIHIRGGHKKLSRFFIDEKIPRKYRKKWPIFIDYSDNIISVPKMNEVKLEGEIKMQDEIFKEILISEEKIDSNCLRLAKEIENDYKNKESVIFLGLLKGCHPFMTDLLRHINLNLQVDYMDVSSFFGKTHSDGEVHILKDMSLNPKGRDIIIVEDIVDSGRTLKKVIGILEDRGANSVEVVAMMDKPKGRVVELKPKYIGVEVPKAFLIGYGLDYDDYFRTLRMVGVPKDEIIKEKDEKKN